MYETKASRYKTQMTLTIKQFSAQDIGTYNCISTNSIGKTEGTITLYGELKSLVEFKSKVFKIVSSSTEIKRRHEDNESDGNNNSFKGVTQVTMTPTQTARPYPQFSSSDWCSSQLFQHLIPIITAQSHHIPCLLIR